jgi:MGT family glycosyltransferase
MANHLIVTWDGAGNLVSTLGIARALVAEGHDVRLMGHQSIDDRCGSHGWRFLPLQHVERFDNTEELDPADEVARLTATLWCSGGPAADVRDELDREPADVLLIDSMLWGALCAGQAAGIPTVALFHSAASLFRAGPLVDLLAPGLPLVQRLRSELGLAPIDALSDVHDACDAAIVATAREFDVPVPLPEQFRFVGPILDGPPLTTEVDTIDLPPGDEPLVLVSFSTSYQDQLDVLQRTADALADLPVRAVVTTGPSVDPADLKGGANTTVARYVQHEQLLPHASLVVTHAGLGTVMSALTHGVPMVCVPMGRDQLFNAAMVERLGAGVALAPDADQPAIAMAVQTVLGSDEHRTAAAGFAEVIAGYGGAAAAVELLGQIAGR